MYQVKEITFSAFGNKSKGYKCMQTTNYKTIKVKEGKENLF